MDSQIRGRHSANMSIQHLVQIARCRIAFKSWTMQFTSKSRTFASNHCAKLCSCHNSCFHAWIRRRHLFVGLSGHRSHVPWQCQTRMATTCMDHATPAEANSREMPGMIDHKTYNGKGHHICHRGVRTKPGQPIENATFEVYT